MQFDVSDIDHVALRVGDIDEALGFYHGFLGLPIRDTDAFEAGDLPFATVVTGGRHLHLFPSDGPIETGNDHVCLLVRSDDTDTRAAMERLIGEIESAGYTVEDGEPEERLGAYGRDWAVYVRDPDGRLVELKLH